jgi:hypothetical protein
MRREYLLGVGLAEGAGVEGLTGEAETGVVITGGPLSAGAKELGGLEGMRVDVGGKKVEMVGRPFVGMVGDVTDEGLDVDVLSHTSKLTCVR